KLLRPDRLLPLPRRIVDYCNARQCDCRANYVEQVRRYAFKRPSPEYGHHDKDSTVCRVDSVKVRWLECRHYSIEKKHKTTQSSQHPAHAIPKPQPHKVAASYLTQAS